MEELCTLVERQHAAEAAAAPVLPGQEPPPPARMVLPVWMTDVDTVLDAFDAVWSHKRRNPKYLPTFGDPADWRAALQALQTYNGPRQAQVRFHFR